MRCRHSRLNTKSRQPGFCSCWPTRLPSGDCAFIATGHYARIEVDGEGLSHLLPAADAEADQSAALAGLPQEVLAKLVLPLGEFTKAEVAEMLADTAE